MTLWGLIAAQIRSSRLSFILVSGLAGLLMSRLVFGIASSAADRSLDDPVVQGIGGIVTISVIQFCRAWTGWRISLWFARAARSMRRHLLISYLHLEPASLAQIDAGHLRQSLASVPRRIANLMESAGSSALSPFMVGGTLTAVLLVNTKAGVSLIFLIVVYALYLLSQVQAMRDSETLARRQDVAVARGLGDLLRGFKETKLDPAKLEALQRIGIEGAMQRRVAARAVFRARLGLTSVITRSVHLISALVCIVVVRLTGEHPEHAGLLMVVVLLFYFGWLQLIPLLASAAATSHEMAALDRDLAAAARQGPPEADRAVVETTPFASLELRCVVYSHKPRPGAPGFVIGPLSCVVMPGQITFVTGGNGSGKSTLTRLLCGLNAPDRGEVFYNGHLIDGRAVRERIAVVPAHPVLFERLHGVAANPEMIRAQLDDFGLGRAVRFENGAFSRLSLSTGQRKRMALIAALQMRRPILLLDEWAADQDPPMRQRFYREILPGLRAQGLCIIAVTHDDRYFDAADQVLHMEQGQLVA